MRNIDDLMTPEELAYDLFKGLTDYELNINTRWLKDVFRVLRVGGIWGWPEAGRTFRKVSSVHFVEVLFEEE
jgi:hypothetical protein|tara:strand:+ start:43 stop:258 length:216 start_codon:yes stop_codon:yes gene_type:complete